MNEVFAHAGRNFCLNRDEKSFGDFYKVVYPIFKNFSYKNYSNAGLEGIESAISTTFLNIHQKIDQFDYTKSSFSTWCFAILKNQLLITLRNKRYLDLENLSSKDMEFVSSNNIEDWIEDEYRQDLLIKVNTAINKLEDKHKDVLIDKFLKGMTIIQLQEKYGLNENTVKTRIHTALFFIRRHLRSNDYALKGFNQTKYTLIDPAGNIYVFYGSAQYRKFLREKHLSGIILDRNRGMGKISTSSFKGINGRNRQAASNTCGWEFYKEHIDANKY